MTSSNSAAESIADTSPAALTDAFAAAMARIGGFEPAPSLAVAVSGGADSLALTLLAARWAIARGGKVTALTVDHGLRHDAAAEAVQVGAWLRRYDVAHRILVWPGPYPTGNIQAVAREARYRLLEGWCRRHGILHLLTAHHRDDQAETLILRLGRGSGLSGLAGMAPVVEDGACRLLRPLLGVPSIRLREWLGAQGQAWLDDPSNRNPAFARARLRGTGLAALGLEAARLADTARHLGRARIALEGVTERLLARAAQVHPAGFVRLDPAALLQAPDEIRLRALAAAVATVGGAAYPPRFERLELLADVIRDGSLGRGRTLGGCRIRPWRDGLLVERELAAIAAPIILSGVDPLLWDRRFLVEWLEPEAPSPGLRIGALGGAVGAVPSPIVAGFPAHHLPVSVRPSLPVLWRDDRVAAIPHLGWWRPDERVSIRLRFRPARSLCGSGFTAA